MKKMFKLYLITLTVCILVCLSIPVSAAAKSKAKTATTKTKTESQKAKDTLEKKANAESKKNIKDKAKEAKENTQKKQVLKQAQIKANQLNKVIKKYGWEITYVEIKKHTKKEARLFLYLECPDDYMQDPVELRVKRVYSGTYNYTWYYAGQKISKKDIIYTCELYEYDPYSE